MSLIYEDLKLDYDNIKINDNLNELLFTEDESLRPKVRKMLLKIGILFLKSLEIENKIKINDIILVGSMINYNYQNNSDIDIHIILDKSKINDDIEFIDDYFRAKGKAFIDDNEFKLGNHDIEIYVEDIDTKSYSSGKYSLLEDKWITKPIKNVLVLDKDNIEKKYNKITKEIDELLNSGNASIDDIEKIKEKIRKMRNIGLKNGGEFSTENLTFKFLRMNKYFDKLKELKKKLNKEYITEIN
jgi:hypothetical protein